MNKWGTLGADRLDSYQDSTDDVSNEEERLFLERCEEDLARRNAGNQLKAKRK
jgi:hypothetical protein